MRTERCAYVRVSKVGGREGDSFHSPDQQEQEIRRTSRSPVTAVFSDLDVSGGKFERDGLDAALAWCREKNGRGIGVYDIDRLGRDMVESLILVRRLQDEGIPVEVRGEEVETRTSDGVLRWGIPMTIAESYLRKVGERWRSVQARRVEQGKPLNGQPRLGYVRGEDGLFRPDPVTGTALRECYVRYAAGSGFDPLVEWLREQGVRSTRGNVITVPSLRGALDSGFGAGKLIVRGEYLPGVHEPVITEDEWKRYLRVRSDRKQLRTRAQSPTWFLASIVRCGVCGGRMNINSFHALPSKSLACCVTESCPERTKMIRVGIENLVAKWVGSQVDALASHVDSDERDARRTEVEAQRDAALAEVAATEAALGRLATLLALAQITESEFRASRDELRDRLEAARQEAQSAYTELDRLAPVDADAYQRLASWGEGTSTGEWRELLRKVIDRVEVTKADGVTIYPRIGEPVHLGRPPRAAYGSRKRAADGTFAA